MNKAALILAWYRAHGTRIVHFHFLKKDGTHRTIGVNPRTRRGINGKGMSYDAPARGLLPVYDNALAKAGNPPSKCWRMVTLAAVYKLSTDNATYHFTLS
jgi:hypothetical protein